MYRSDSSSRILTGHFVMLCSHWLILTLSSRVVHFFSSRSQPQYGSLAPTQALKWEKEVHNYHISKHKVDISGLKTWTCAYFFSSISLVRFTGTCHDSSWKWQLRNVTVFFLKGVYWYVYYDDIYLAPYPYKLTAGENKVAHAVRITTPDSWVTVHHLWPAS